MLSIYQCPVCGGRECTTSGNCARGCVSPIKTVVTVSDVCGDELARLTRERDEARQAVVNLQQALVLAQGERDEAIALATAMKTASVIAIREREQAERERDEARALLREAHQTILKLADQQAMPDEWWRECADRLKAALEGRDA